MCQLFCLFSKSSLKMSALKLEKCLHRRWEMPEYQAHRGQWSTQTRDRWGRCGDEESKGVSHLFLNPGGRIPWWLDSLHSPLDHFSFGLSRVAPQHCQEVFGGHTLPETARQKSQIGPENLLWMLVNSTKTHISGVVFGHAPVNVRAVGPVYQHPRGGVPRNITNNNNKKTRN